MQIFRRGLGWKFLGGLVFVIFAQGARAESGAGPTAKLVAEGMDVVWAIEFLSDTEALISERDGKMSILDLKSGAKTAVKGVPEVEEDGQGGLLDVALHPDFKKNKLVYITYSGKQGKGVATTLSRAELVRAEGGPAELKNLKVLFFAEPAQTTDIHFGSRVAFGRDGMLYLTCGERNQRDLAQDKKTHLGKVIRMTQEGQNPEVFTYGHRNPQGIDVDPVTGDIYAIEHGPRGGDEINLLKAGANYGWPVVSYGREYWGPKIGEGPLKPGIEPPVKYFLPSIGPGSLLIYSGKKYPDWRGTMFSGALALRHLNQVWLKDGKPVDEKRYFESLKERVRDVRESPSGEIYFTTDSGKIYRLER